MAVCGLPGPPVGESSLQLLLSLGSSVAASVIQPRLNDSQPVASSPVLAQGVKQLQNSAQQCVCLPIMVAIMHRLQAVWVQSPSSRQFDTTMLWATARLGCFGLMRTREFTMKDPNEPPAIRVFDVAVDSHANLSMLRVLLHRAKTDPFS